MMGRPEPPEIRVRNRHSRYGFDGETGVLIPHGMRGTIGAMTINAKQPTALPTLTVYWDAVVVQDKSNDEPSTTPSWEESNVQPDAVEVIYEEVPRG